MDCWTSIIKIQSDCKHVSLTFISNIKLNEKLFNLRMTSIFFVSMSVWNVTSTMTSQLYAPLFTKSTFKSCKVWPVELLNWKMKFQFIINVQLQVEVLQDPDRQLFYKKDLHKFQLWAQFKIDYFFVSVNQTWCKDLHIDKKIFKLV